jgi:hypothetical protein
MPLIVSFPFPARGGSLLLHASLPTRGRALLSLLPTEGKGLAWCPTTPYRAGRLGQSLPEGFPWASFLDAFQEMVKGKGCHHDRAFEDIGREALTTSSRSSAARAALAEPLALRYFS